LPRIPVLRHVDLDIPAGRALGVIGESGCGKSTLARAIAGLTPFARGTVHLSGHPLAPSVAERSRAELREIQLVFQMADTALNPRVSIDEIIGRPLTFFFGLKGAERARRVRELLELTHLPADVLTRLPGDLSGGQKQRVNLARALAAKPSLLLCDEVTSALDTVVAAAILDLLADLRKELGLTMMFISHDLKTIRAICDEVLVLYAGQVVQTMPATAISARQHHPYAQLLFSSVPELRQGWLDAIVPPALPATASDAQTRTGCAFFHRCNLRIPGTCDRAVPPMRLTDEGVTLACHHPLSG
jgi:peptide/nickel transport system ATP-binding protein